MHSNSLTNREHRTKKKKQKQHEENPKNIKKEKITFLRGFAKHTPV
jgi:hypothetical protein